MPTCPRALLPTCPLRTRTTARQQKCGEEAQGTDSPQFPTRMRFPSLRRQNAALNAHLTEPNGGAGARSALKQGCTQEPRALSGRRCLPCVAPAPWFFTRCHNFTASARWRKAYRGRAGKRRDVLLTLRLTSPQRRRPPYFRSCVFSTWRCLASVTTGARAPL